MPCSPESHNPQEPAKTSRREFLKSIAAIGAAAALTSCGAEFLNKPLSSAEKQELEEIIDGITIEGSPEFIEATKVALYALRGSSFEEMRQYLERIRQNTFSGILPSEKIPTFEVGEKTWNASAPWYASTIAHDTYHSFLYHDYDEKIPGNYVNPKAWTGKEAEQKCLKFQLKILQEINGDNKDIEHVKKLMENPTYQDVDIKDRDW